MTYFVKHPSNKLARASYHESFPPVNILESDEGWEINIVAPGRNRGDFKLEVKDKKLHVSYEEKGIEEKNDKGYTRKEFDLHSFERSFYLPESVAKDQIKAAYEKGILNVSIPKKEEEKPQLISIDVA